MCIMYILLLQYLACALINVCSIAYMCNLSTVSLLAGNWPCL